jgi:SPP1 gp7 family putative phage head morphogenesis protein
MEPLTTSFWLNEAALLHALVFEIVEEAARAGAYFGVRQVVQMLLGVREPAVNYDLLNERAFQYAQQASFDLVSGVTETSRRALQAEFSEWIGSGDPLDALTEKLAPLYGPVRADMIAATEVTRIYAESNIIGWRETGMVDGQRFQTAYDDIVCPICQPLNGEESAIGQSDHTPPLHVRCRCYLQPVVKVPKMLELELEAV